MFNSIITFNTVVLMVGRYINYLFPFPFLISKYLFMLYFVIYNIPKTKFVNDFLRNNNKNNIRQINVNTYKQVLVVFIHYNTLLHTHT